MDLYKAAIATLLVVIGFPAFVGVISFITWENGFKVLGWPFVARMTLVLIVIIWVITFTPGGN